MRDPESLDEATRLLIWVALHGGWQAPIVNVQGAFLLNLSAAIEPTVDREARERYFLRAAWIVNAARDQVPRSFQRRAALAAIWFWQGRRATSKVIDALDAAIERFGRDPALLLAQGTLWETIAGLRDEDRPKPTNGRALEGIVDFPGFDLHPKPMWTPTHRIYEACAMVFEKALRQSTDLDEARVRLAHVQLALDRNAAAAQEVAPLLNRTAVDKENPVSYFAALVHGRAMLALEKPEAALSSMRHAVSLCADCQTAKLALSQALRATGDRRGAIQAVREVLEQGRRDVRADPWWEYPAGQAWELPGLLSTMLREAKR